MEGDRVALVIDTGRLTVLKDPDKAVKDSAVSGKRPTNS
jgi:hypothetical protein